MKNHRLAIVRQKYRPDGGAERFVSRALTALSNQNLELNVITREWQGEKQDDWHIHICNPQNGAASVESADLHRPRARCGSNSSLILFKAMSASRVVISIARVMGCIVAGCFSARAFYLPGVRKC